MLQTPRIAEFETDIGRVRFVDDRCAENSLEKIGESTFRIIIEYVSSMMTTSYGLL